MASASLARTMASAFLRLSQNHWKIIGKLNQEVGLLYDLFCDDIACACDVTRI
jgi:hypothetical protein